MPVPLNHPPNQDMQDINLEGLSPVRPADETSSQAEPAEPTSVDKRIGVITKKFRDEERKTAGLESQLSLLTTQNQALMSKMDTLVQPASPAPSNEPLNDFFGQNAKPVGTVQTRQEPLTEESIQRLIKATVEQAVKPFQEEKVQDQQAAILHEQQQVSFNDAIEALPGVQTSGSREQQLFDQILKGNPGLELLPNAPAIVINAVAGILSGQTQATTQEHKKQVASSPAPTHSLDRTAILQTPESSSDLKTEELKQALLEKGRSSEGLTDQENMALMGTLLGRARVK